MRRTVAYLTLQATRAGQAAHAHVHEIIDGMRELGWSIELFEPSYPPESSPGALRRLFEFRRLQQRLIGRLSDFDAVYIRAHPLAYQVSRAARKRGILVVQECNGHYQDMFAAWPAARPMRPLFEAWQREQYHNADAVIAVTSELARWVEREASRADAVVVPNGANTQAFRPGLPAIVDLPQPYAIFFGALAVWQGIPVMLEAVGSPVWPREVALVIAGDGPLRSEVEQAAERNPLIRYVGTLGYDVIPSVISNALVSLCAKVSLPGGQRALSPLKLYESMAAGTPLVVSDLPGLVDAVEGASCGIVIPEGDAVALARAVARLAADQRIAQEMGLRGRTAAVADHSWSARAAETAGVLRTVMEQRA